MMPNLEEFYAALRKDLEAQRFAEKAEARAISHLRLLGDAADAPKDPRRLDQARILAPDLAEGIWPT